MSAAPALTVVLRPEEAGDDAFLCELYATTREQELSIVPWSEDERRAFCDSQSRIQRLAYRGQFPSADFDVILVDGRPAGRLAVDRTEDDIHVIDIALLPEHRGQGTGSSLLTHLVEEADRNGRSVSLHVERTNPAWRLYERLGFRAVGEAGLSVLMRWSGA
ncbi:MAG TPA: GNAT family N-acetyltransferase [Acidimicrobiales bacterium]|jgi:ribosomal protein S18 acetylase RimI-like enzyme|nr:GNAT family N-acetyltransferase [Acidimicrobiales bacterium]